MGIAGLIIGSAVFFWYLKTLPEVSRGLIDILATPGLKRGIFFSLSLLILYFIYANIKPLSIRLIPAIVAIAVLFIGIWSTERIRELIRKPYIIPGYMYSNQIIGKDIPAKGVSAETKIINEKGILKVSPFVPEGLRDINETNLLQTGKMIALRECLSCHVLNEKGLRPMPQMVKKAWYKKRWKRQRVSLMHSADILTCHPL